MLNLRIALIDTFMEYLENRRSVLTAEENAKQIADLKNGSVAMNFRPRGNGQFDLENLTVLDLHDLRRMARFAQEFMHDSKVAYFFENYLDQILTDDDKYKYKRGEYK